MLQKNLWVVTGAGCVGAKEDVDVLVRTDVLVVVLDLVQEHAKVDVADLVRTDALEVAICKSIHKDFRTNV